METSNYFNQNFKPDMEYNLFIVKVISPVFEVALEEWFPMRTSQPFLLAYLKYN